MTQLKVWAPLAGKVELVSDGRRMKMERMTGGWWISGEELESGTDYAYLVDGEGPWPDPRSPWQPQGVHGLSRCVDHGKFNWSDGDYRAPRLSTGIIYELHVGTFSRAGTFEGVLDHLHHLKSLGVTHVELMPVAEFSGRRGWGYDGVDLYAPHHAYGGPEGLKRLVDTCHREGLAVLLDVVYNHFGPEGNYLRKFGPYLTDRYATPWGEAVNLDGPHSDEVRRFFIDNTLMWLRDYHIDGLRIDAVHAFVDLSAIHFLEQLTDEVHRFGAENDRQPVIIAESDLNDPRIVNSPAAGGYGMDAQWNEDFHHALHTVLSGERDGYYQDFGTLAQLAKVLSRVFTLDGVYSTYRRRHHGRPTGSLPGSKFIGCLQNHDQVGNRAFGDRSSHLLSTNLSKVGAALVLTAPFVPLLFQGEEWAASTPFLYFTDHQDQDLGEAVKKGRRREFSSFDWQEEEIPDPQAESTFSRSKLIWEEINSEPHSELRNWYHDLIALRRSTPSLQEGRLEDVTIFFDELDRWLVMTRRDVTVLCNFSGSQRQLSTEMGGKTRVLLASAAGITVEEGRIMLPPESAAILIDER